MWWCTYGPNWQAVRTVDEFSGTVDNGLVCGPAANANLWATMHQVAPTPALVDQITRRDTAAGIFASGQTITNVYQSYVHGWGWPAAKVSLRPYSATTYGAGDISAACEHISTSRNGGIIVEVSRAYNLPYNEPGVQYHFVALLGYDAGTGMVLVGNADREPLPHGTGTPDWYTVNQLAAGGVVGILTVLGDNGMSSGVPAGWSDDGTTLTAPNRVPVVTGFRDYILGHIWDPADVPLAPETANVAPLEYNNLALGGGSLQYFVHTILEWRLSDQTVYPLYPGRELMVCRQMIAGAQAALKASYP